MVSTNIIAFTKSNTVQHDTLAIVVVAAVHVGYAYCYLSSPPPCYSLVTNTIFLVHLRLCCWYRCCCWWHCHHSALLIVDITISCNKSNQKIKDALKLYVTTIMLMSYPKITVSWLLLQKEKNLEVTCVSDFWIGFIPANSSQGPTSAHNQATDYKYHTGPSVDFLLSMFVIHSNRATGFRVLGPPQNPPKIPLKSLPVQK